jgi:hypothetical protein
MIEWKDFENKIIKSFYYKISNNSKKKIVLFGNCHVATLGFFLNYLFNKQYDIYIIISWLFDKIGYEKFNMEIVNNKINFLLSNCDIFIYQKHIKSYGVNADIIEDFVKYQSIKIKIPNLRLVFNSNLKEEYLNSVQTLKFSIMNSDIKEFYFIIDKLTEIQFFNTPEHPTHYLLYLLAKCIKQFVFYKFNSVAKLLYKPLTVKDYYSPDNRNSFKKIENYVILPGYEKITECIMNITGIKLESEHFD